MQETDWHFIQFQVLSETTQKKLQMSMDFRKVCRFFDADNGSIGSKVSFIFLTVVYCLDLIDVREPLLAEVFADRDQDSESKGGDSICNFPSPKTRDRAAYLSVEIRPVFKNKNTHDDQECKHSPILNHE